MITDQDSLLRDTKIVNSLDVMTIFGPAVFTKQTTFNIYSRDLEFLDLTRIVVIKETVCVLPVTNFLAHLIIGQAPPF